MTVNETHFEVFTNDSAYLGRYEVETKLVNRKYGKELDKYSFILRIEEAIVLEGPIDKGNNTEN